MNRLFATDVAPIRCPVTEAANITLDSAGLVVSASAAALAVLAANPTVLQVNHRLLRAPQRQTWLTHCLAQARSDRPSALALPRLGRLPLTLRCERCLLTDGSSGWLLTLRDPETEFPDARLVQAMFDLTAAEAAVATALAQGRSTAEIALVLQVQPNTVLTHLKKVLSKTGTRRQAELVSLLLRSVAMSNVEALTTKRRPPPRNAGLNPNGIPV